MVTTNAPPIPPTPCNALLKLCHYSKSHLKKFRLINALVISYKTKLMLWQLDPILDSINNDEKKLNG